ncbi:NADH:flavin oxidoreductase/NADH oxidase [Epithele typhae]|uniref:NADH:flavin oxidoreductase/NADH oxidase n=1 Tax=Epithele typhae TaxID=378194 RepID=UPI0020082FB9|nr:NADH:flavin oxidoreductase/NADH oxidase [Epithele typhae]KAH9929569.1 NADH:flavin oxidoreductase/NADH oxidase [Epithele typhae]
MPSIPALFQTIRVGTMQLGHRVAMAPMTRMRADAAHVPTDLMVEYYTQRASVPGTLLVSEAVFIAPQAGIIPHVPGIYKDAQIAAWKKVTDAVHAKGSYIVCQLWALGRSARPALLQLENPKYPHVAPSPIALKSSHEAVPRALTTDEIAEYVQLYAQAAKNAISAGFDAVEVHGASGYLLDQFTQSVSNTRTDAYGASAANRARFPLEVLDAVVRAVGAERSAYRLSPWNLYQDMRMDDKETRETFTYLISEFKARFPGLAYLHVVASTADFNKPPEDPKDEQVLHELWAPLPYISTGGYTRATALQAAEKEGVVIGMGQSFIPNPDLPYRLMEDLPLAAGDPSTFYTGGGAEGYSEFPFSDKFVAERIKA